MEPATPTKNKKKTPADWFPAIMEKRLAAAGPAIRDLARLQYGAEDIGPKVGLTATTVRRYAQALGITLPNNGRKIFRLDRQEWPQKVPPMLKKGLTYRQIAKEMGCSESAVSKWTLNQGLGRRGPRDCR